GSPHDRCPAESGACTGRSGALILRSSVRRHSCPEAVGPSFTQLHHFAADEPRLDRELVRGQAECLLGHFPRHALHLVEDARGLDHTYPLFRSSLALTHTGLERLLGDGLVREDTDPDLAAAFDVTGHGDTSGLDLA